MEKSSICLRRMFITNMHIFYCILSE